MGKVLGLNVKGKKSDTLDKIVELELKDKERNGGEENERHRNILWESLVRLKSIFSNPWCKGGDFNEIRNIGEMIGCSRKDKRMRELNEFIDKYESTDLPLLGRKYTWCKAEENEKWSRINRIMLSPKWLIKFKLKLWGLPRLLSDHCPLLIRDDEKDIQKLKLLKLALKKWNCDVFGNISTKLKAAEVELHDLDISAEERPLIESERDRRRIKHEALLYFEEQFTEDWANRPSLGGMFKLVQVNHFFHELETKFSEAKIKAAIKECNGNKTPGLDGFNLPCFQKYWKVIKKEILMFIRDFHTHCKLTYGINSSFITLIPKNENPVELGNYRPISLVGSIYKILSKVLAHRQKKVILEVIGDTQSAFLGKMNILDGVLIANDVMDSWKKSKKKIYHHQT
ncbi:uncharacterized protein LOC114315090 [Camellia sinensis]|uniref:uncharacterized protein LOC114315090 n=1 Tax=Camellia sinensis TaxID=4442 RepID=UPI001036215A|nr:uncharacterized protein LOC114315090 [Camellia sinensis]